MNLTSFGHVSYYYFFVTKISPLGGEKKKKKKEKKEKKKKKKKRLMQLLQRNFLEKNGPKSLITPRGFLFLFLFYEIAQSRLICSRFLPENYSIIPF